MVGERTGGGFRLGDSVEVRLLEAAPVAGTMRLEMLTDPKPMPGAERSWHKARRGGRPRNLPRTARRK
jgi:ribonuclease R